MATSTSNVVATCDVKPKKDSFILCTSITNVCRSRVPEKFISENDIPIHTYNCPNCDPNDPVEPPRHLNQCSIFKFGILISICQHVNFIFAVSLFLFREGHLDIVQYLVDGGHCQPNSKDSGGGTALHLAAA